VLIAYAFSRDRDSARKRADFPSSKRVARSTRSSIARSLDESENASVSGRSHTETLNRPPGRLAWHYATDYLICNNGRSVSIVVAGLNCDELHLVAPSVRRSPNRTDPIGITRTRYDDRDYRFRRFPFFRIGKMKQETPLTDITTAQRIGQREFDVRVNFVSTLSRLIRHCLSPRC